MAVVWIMVPVVQEILRQYHHLKVVMEVQGFFLLQTMVAVVVAVQEELELMELQLLVDQEVWDQHLLFLEHQ